MSGNVPPADTSPLSALALTLSTVGPAQILPQAAVSYLLLDVSDAFEAGAFEVIESESVLTETVV